MSESPTDICNGHCTVGHCSRCKIGLFAPGVSTGDAYLEMKAERDALREERASAYRSFTSALVNVLSSKTDPELITAILEDMQAELHQ